MLGKVAFVGLGRMGHRMALNAQKSGFEVFGYDISAAACELYASRGGRVAVGVPEACAGADFVVTMLNASTDVAEVLFGKSNALSRVKPDAVLLDCSTVDIDGARANAEKAGKLGFSMLDAPVSGGVLGAEEARLTFMVGGSQPALERARKLLECMGKQVLYAGPAGSGQAAKICNNMMMGISLVAACEGFVMGTRLGLDPKVLHDIVNASSGQSWIVTHYCPVPGPVPSAPANHDFAPGFTTTLMLKDMDLANRAAELARVDTPMARLATDRFRAAADAGYAEKDCSVVARLVPRP